MKNSRYQLALLIFAQCVSGAFAQTWKPVEGSPHEHLRNGQPLKALQQLDSNPGWILIGDPRERTPLHYSANFGHKEVAAWLLNNGAEVNAAANTRESLTYCGTDAEVAEIVRKPYGETPLFYANTREMAKLLLENGAAINAVNNRGETPLFLTTSLEVAKLLVERVPDLELKDNFGRTALQSISYSIANHKWKIEGRSKDESVSERIAIAFALIDAGANYDIESAIYLGDLPQVKRLYVRGPLNDYSTALKTAVGAGEIEVCRYLLAEESVDFSKPKEGFDSLFYWALQHPNLVKLFIERGADVNTTLRLSGGMSGIHIIGFEALVIHHAVNIGAPPESIRLILDAGAGPFDECKSIESDSDGDASLVTPLDVAFFHGGFFDNSDVTFALVSHPNFKMDLERERQELFDRLLCGFFGMKNSSDLVQVLLKKGADPGCEFNGFTALESNWYTFEVFSRKKDFQNQACLECAKLLIRHGAKQDLLTAIMLGDETSAMTLQKAGEKLRHEKLELIAIANCIKNQEVQLLRILLDSGLKIREGPLQWTASLGYPEMAKMLLHYGADVDGKGEQFVDNSHRASPPLHCAVRAGNTEIVEILLLNGADPEIRDSKGRTPLERCENQELKVKMQKIFAKHSMGSDR